MSPQTTPLPKRAPLAQLPPTDHATRAFKALVRAGLIVPVSPEPHVYGWAQADAAEVAS